MKTHTPHASQLGRSANRDFCNDTLTADRTDHLHSKRYEHNSFCWQGLLIRRAVPTIHLPVFLKCANL